MVTDTKKPDIREKTILICKNDIICEISYVINGIFIFISEKYIKIPDNRNEENPKVIVPR